MKHLDFRGLFDLPEDIAYFNIAGVSPLLKSAALKGEEALHLKSQPWKIDKSIFFDQVEVARSLFAELISSSPDDVAIVPSATYGVEVATNHIYLSGFLAAGDKILVQEEEFPALIFPLKKLCERTGAQLEFIPRPPDGNWTESICTSMDSKTKIVAVGIAHWTDGTLLDGIKVSEKARSVGAQLWIDGCQSLGAIPFSVKDVKPDYLFAPTYKWLMGPYTYGFLYVSADHQDKSPLEEYWANRFGAEDFSKLIDYEIRYKKGARRFDMSERSQFINTAIAIEALRKILEWTPEQISKRLEKITDSLADFAMEKGYLVAPKEFRNPHFIGLRRRDGFSLDFLNELQSQGIHAALRGDCLRVSPHLYTTERDLKKLLAAL